MMNSKLPTFGKSDFSWSYLAIALGGLAVAVFAVIKPLVLWLGGQSLEAEVRLLEGAPLDLDATAGTTLVGHLASAILTDASTATWLARIGLGLLLTLAVLAVLFLLLRFMRSVAAGDAFTAANVRRLRAMAAILFLGPVIGSWAQAFWNGHLLSVVFDIENTWVVHFDHFHFTILGFGALLACVAEVFRHGVQLEDDTEGLV